uniref:Periodic tryptophan protein 1 n=1 Tax=Parascaris univalens TaxID=6257 RepID=A0A914ZCG4_PARUN
MVELFEVQSMEWHPGEGSVLLSGTLSGELIVADCRQREAEASRKWKVDGEVEKVLWDHFSPFYFFATTDDGKLRYMDSRVEKVVFERDAHEGGARSVSQSFHVRGLLSTCGADSVSRNSKIDGICDWKSSPKAHRSKLKSMEVIDSNRVLF